MTRLKLVLSLVGLLTIGLLTKSLQAEDNDHTFEIKDTQIPAGQALVLQYQPGQPITVIHNPVSLTTTAQQAVELAPDWLKIDLIHNLSQLNPISQTTYAQLILDCPAQKYLDEIAFCIAHISPVVLKHAAFDPSIITTNAEHIYRAASELDYVELIGQDDNTTTARYQLTKEGSTQHYTLPSEYYYWYVVHPQFFTEVPRKISDLFWREYFLNHTDEGYLRLDKSLKGVKYVWDSQPITIPLKDWSKNAPLLTYALPNIGYWTLTQVPAPRYPEMRMLQPNNVLQSHCGTDTEHQVVLAAAARAALIPAAYVRNFSDNQQWVAFYLLDQWWPYQTQSEGLKLHIAQPDPISRDRTRGGTKTLSALSLVRGDGYITERIQDHAQTRSVKTKVSDQRGRPIDNACVRIKTPRAPAATGYCGFLATFGYTNINGECTFTLGQQRDYEIFASAPGLGKSQGIRILATLPENPNPYPLRLPQAKKDIDFGPGRVGPGKTMFTITCQPHTHIISGANLLQDFRKPEVKPIFSQKLPGGNLKAFICDAVNYAKYKKNQPFACFTHETHIKAGEPFLLTLPHRAKCFLIFHNDSHQAKVITNISIE